ncbi:MAG: hypothetical protein KGK30_05390, partial [Elusimicrobia bacterium]|nr:hypothetical protein [Elusimicrobiota bacterium]
MKRAALKALSLAAALTLSARLACAAVPQYINYQGKLGDASGNPLTGTYSFQFTFYDAASGGNQLFQEQWTGTSNAVGVVNGIYSVQIGSLTVGGIPASTFDGSSVYLEIAVNLGTSLSGAETLSPRERLAASVYSIHSRTAEYLGTGVDIATFTSVGYLLVPVGLSIGTSSTTSVLAVVSTYTYAASTTSLVNLSPIGLNTNSLA